MNDLPEMPTPDESLRACFIAFDRIVEGVTNLMAFCNAAREQGPEAWRTEAAFALQEGEFTAIFLGVLQRALTDLRIATPEEQK